ncbi:UTRA domain-containing protein, partial [Actinospica durhamensis]
HKVILVARRVPAERVARLLGIAPDEPAVLRRRLVTLDGVPVEVSDSWYPARVADGTQLAEDRPIKGGAVRALAERGYLAARHVEEVAVVDVPAELSTLLPHPPVIELTRASYAAPADLAGTAAPAGAADGSRNEAGGAFEVAVMLMSREMAPGVPRRLRYTFRPGSTAGS